MTSLRWDLGEPFFVVAGLVLLVVTAGAVLARHTAASLAAGATLLLARVYSRGERIRLYAPEIGSYVEAEIVRVGMINTTLATPDGLLIVPNTRLLRTAPDAPVR